MRQLPRAFTLFEIAISLAILATAVITIAGLFPVGIRAQQLSRQRIHAVNISLNLMDSWGQTGHSNPNRQAEAEHLSQNTAMHRSREDFERALGDNSMCPLPPAIAARLDSDNDEIRDIIADGGRLYYPAAALGVPQTLLVAVVGYPQQNALPNHPCLAWPYIDHVPGPPHDWELNNWTANPTWPCLTEFTNLHQVFDSSTHATTAPDTALAAAYLLKAQELVDALATAFALANPVLGGPGNGKVPAPPTALPATVPWDVNDRQVFPHPAWCWALSHLAHAAACQTAPQITIAPGASTYADAAYASASAWMMRYSATDPYDWGMARDGTHQSAWDYPLLQFDLFPSASFPLYTSASVTSDPAWRDDVSWRVVGREQARNVGQARGHHGWAPLIAPNKPNIDQSWGDPSHFTLCRAFQPSERARQLVCFSVDWQAYEDFEEQPAAPQDSGFGIFDSQGVQVGSEAYGLLHCERAYFFRNQNRDGIANTEADFAIHQWGEGQANAPSRKATMLGLFGADRNGDGEYDRGPLPTSTRMKAVTVTRFNFYDRIVPFSIKG